MKYWEKWKIKLNHAKTEQIVLSRKYKNKIIQPLKISNQTIAHSSSTTDLGIKLHSRLRFTHHITAQIIKAHTIITKLYPLINKKSSLSMQNKKLLYTTIIRPTLTYAAPIFNHISNLQLHKLQIIQNKCLKLITKSNIYTKITHMHKITNLLTIRQYISTLSNKFYYNTFNHSNPIIKNITKTRFDSNLRSTHSLPYQNLNIYNESFT